MEAKKGTLFFSWSQVCLRFFWNNLVNPSSIFSGQTSLPFVVPLRHSVYDSANLFQFHGPTQLIQLRKQEGWMADRMADRFSWRGER